MSLPKYAEILSDDEVNYLTKLRVDKNFNANMSLTCIQKILVILIMKQV